MQDYVDARKAASTIRSVYSALLFHFRLNGRAEFLTNNPIIQMFVDGAQKLIQMFVDGAQKLAPPPNKKVVIWDPETPLSFINSRPRPTEFRAAGQEALLLVLLATGMRVDCASKLSKTVIKRAAFCQIEFLLPRKTGHSGPQVLRRFLENQRLCPVEAIDHFQSLAKKIRKPAENFLFISSKGKRAHIDTLRHWVTDLLEECGIQASAGTCRSASASAAVARDVDVDVVLKAAGWKKESTFRRYYQRQVLKANEGYNLIHSTSIV